MFIPPKAGPRRPPGAAPPPAGGGVPPPPPPPVGTPGVLTPSAAARRVGWMSGARRSRPWMTKVNVTDDHPGIGPRSVESGL
ncbi:MAG: hypothetical protein D6724_01400 [Armatimonadetes bacterium]|nr:MAG: hypothetical protein D6724_01400 [Armatimonadota bacterium]